MRKYTTSTMTAEVFDADPYLFERNVLKFKSSQNFVYLKNNNVNIATYSYVSNYEILVDLTEYVIANPNPSKITIYDGTNTINITWNASGKLFNPRKNQRPNYPFARFFTEDGKPFSGDERIIFAPTSIFAGDHFLGYCGDGVLDYYLDSSGSDIIDGNICLIETQDTDTHIGIGISGVSNIYNLSFRKQNSCLQYIDIRWECMFAKEMYKKHKFELYSNNESVASSQELYNYLDGGLALQEKSRQEKITVRLDDLTAYDIWYYSDLLTSSKVFALINNEWQRVQVITKSIDIPFNSVKRHELTIDLLINKGFNL